jgi:hypothetical protein
MRIGYFTEAKLLFLTFSLSVHGAGYFLAVMILLSILLELLRVGGNTS